MKREEKRVEQKSFIRLIEDYKEDLENEEELKPLFDPKSLPRLSEILKLNLDNTSGQSKVIRAKEFQKIWSIISIVHYYKDFTLENANAALIALDDNQFNIKNSSIAYDSKTEVKPSTYSVIADMNLNIIIKIFEALSKVSQKEVIEWILFAEKIRRKWIKHDMKSTLKLALCLFIQTFGQEAIAGPKLVILALKNLAKDKKYKTFLVEAAVKCLEVNIENRFISNQILKLLPTDLNWETLIKIENFQEYLGVWTFNTKREIKMNFKKIRNLIKEITSIKNIWKKTKKFEELLNKYRNNGLKILNKEDIILDYDLDSKRHSKSTIYKGKLISNNKDIIVKEYNIETSKKNIKWFCNEVANAIFLSQKDEIFMEFYGLYIYLKPKNSTLNLENSTLNAENSTLRFVRFGFVMEQCDMDLENAIRLKLLGSDENIEYCIDTLLYGFKLLHDYGIAHRDIKLQNIFVKRNPEGWKLKIADYEISSVVSKGTAVYSELVQTNCCGQTTYFPLEVCSQIDGNTQFLPERIIMNKQKCDVYALGLVFLQLNKQEILFQSITEREWWMEDIGWNYINNEIKPRWLKELLTSMLAKNPSERKRLSELVKIRKSYQISI